MSHIPPPPSFLPAPPKFNAFADSNNNNNQAYHPQAGGSGSVSGSGVNDNYGGGQQRDMYADRNNNNNNNRRKGRGGGGGGRRGGGGGGGRGGDRERSPDRGGRKRHVETRSVEDRIQAERVCRTLFVRNVSYEADSDALQHSFSTYGEIKTWYDRIKERGIIFVTYFDLRAAQRARDAMHSLKAGDRPIDVHYSLPRDKDLIGDCDREKNQGSILVFVHPPRVINEYELGRMCEQFGDVKTIKPGREPAEKIVEYYDSRGSALFYDKMSNQPFQGGTLELKFIWDEKEDALPPPPIAERGSTNHPYRSGEGPGYGEVRGGRHSQPPPPPAHGARDPRARSPIRGGDRRSSYGSNPNPPGPGRYGDGPPPVPPGEDRLEQARKVQQLLANLGGPNPSGPPAPPPQGGFPARGPMPPPPSTMNGPPPYSPRDTGYGPGPGPGPPPSGNYRPGPPPPVSQGGNNNYPLYPPPPQQSYSNPNPAPSSYPSSGTPGNGYNPLPPPPSQNPYNVPPPIQGSYGNPPPPVPAIQSPYNPSTPAPQNYPPYPPASNVGRGYPPPPGQGPDQGQRYGQSSGGYGGYPPPPAPNPNHNPGGSVPGQAKDVGSLLAMLVSSVLSKIEVDRMLIYHDV
ncbi:uncharacterized protein L199_007618 [Kwoniella botswanensis]|uniref:uncharacterized protein n=1 Tax=Kwoniella botswanensis TaxID=1268659 RepID=UPI00315C9FDB